MGEGIIHQALTGGTAICSAGRPLTPGLAKRVNSHSNFLSTRCRARLAYSERSRMGANRHISDVRLLLKSTTAGLVKRKPSIRGRRGFLRDATLVSLLNIPYMLWPLRLRAGD